jgi:Ca2+-binding RTX toxin-like protein
MAIFNGSDINDTFQGTNEDDVLNGAGGNDILSGGPTVFGGSGLGNDVLNGGPGNDTLLAGNGNDEVNGDEGDDEIISGFGDDDVSGGDGNDKITAFSGNPTIEGNAGNDIIEIRTAGTTSNAIVNGGADNDRITATGRRGNETISGGDGNDTINSGDGNDKVFGNAGNDTINAGSGNDLIRGADVGRGERDVVTGSFESDTFQLFNGFTVLYDDRNNASSGLGDFVNITDFTRDRLRSPGDKIEVIGDRNDYFIDNSPVAGIRGDGIFFDSNRNGVFERNSDELIAVTQGVIDLTLDDLTFIDTPINNGTNGSNTLVGAPRRSGLFNARGGNDRVNGRDGDDLINGGSGDDILNGGTGNDTLLGRTGRDRMFGGAGDDLLDGGAGIDTMNGGAGVDTYVLSANSGPDLIRYVDGQDRLALAGGLTFEQLTITQEGTQTVISVGADRLGILENTQASQITTDDFATLNLRFSQIANFAIPVALTYR